MLELLNPATLTNLLSGTIGVLCGAALTALAAFWSEAARDWREYHRAKGHIQSEIWNVRRHYRTCLLDAKEIKGMPRWRQIVQANMWRFIGNGLGSFDVSQLRLFAPAHAEEILQFILVLRNNEFFIDRFVELLTNGKDSEADEVLSELTSRFGRSISIGKELDDRKRWPKRR